MADKEWLTIQPSLEPIMGPVIAVIETIDSVLSAVIVILNIVQTILNIVKVFLVGLLDPIRAIVEAIIEELRNIIHDLRQAGFYIHGDWDLLDSPYDQLRGGFQAYERRMLKRLLDRRDPNRPDFSSASAALAVFGYLSLEDVTLLIEFIMRLRAFFGVKSPTSGKSFPPPTKPALKFGPYAEGFAAFKNLGEQFGEAPDAMVVEWSMPSTGSLFAPAPAGFLIHVSTEPDGFGVQGLKVQAETSDKVESLPALFPVGIDPATGTVLRLYGGVCDLECDIPDSVYESEQGNKVYLTLGANSPLIWPSQLEGDIPLGAASYYVGSGFLSKLGPGQTLSATIQWDQLPKKITAVNNGSAKPDIESEDAYTFYVRVRALAKTYVDAGSALTGTSISPSVVGSSEIKPYRILKDTIKETTGMILKPLDPKTAVASKNFGEASEAAIASFPTDSMLEFMDATRAAIAVLYLTRSDFTEAITDDDGNLIPAINTYLPGAATGLEGFTDMLAKYGDPMNTLYQNDDAPSFRRKIRKKIAGHTMRFLSQPPPESVCAHIAEVGADLITFKWSDINSDWPNMTIMESMGSNTTLSGIAASPLGIGGSPTQRLRQGRLTTPEDLWISRGDVFPISPRGAALAAKTDGYYTDMGYSDWAPVLYDWNGIPVVESWGQADSPLIIAYIRNLLFDYEDGKILQQAQAVLQVAGASTSRSPNQGEWHAVRFFDQALAPLEGVLSDIEKYLLGILDGLKGMIDKIIAYIDAIQARIYQIQALIEMIRAILNSLKVFDLPSFNALVLVENGTDGLITGLITAENKPDDGVAAYGGGVVAIAGGLPTVILEILALLFPPSGGD